VDFFTMLPIPISVLFAFLTTTALIAVVSCQTNGSDQSALMNIWNYQIERKVKTTIKYKERALAVWEQLGTSNSTADRIYYVTPPVTLIPTSASCQYRAITGSYEVVYDIQLWEKELPRAAIEALKQLSLTINENQILPLPFYQARIIWNNPEEQLQQLKLSSAWINNLQQQQTYRFRVAAENNASCQLLTETIRTTPDQFADNLQLQFTVSAAKIDSKVVTIKSEHVTSSQLVATLKNLPNADGANRYLTSSDYNRMLWQISNQVVASEVTSGDYVDADDELSLKDVIAQMFDTQKQNTAQFDDKMWNSVFWDPSDERPDKITNELNKYIFINQTDHRAYLTQAGASSSSAKVNAVFKAITIGGEGAHSSSSSMASDDVGHLLENYDIESQIQGEKFVPKQLDLTRLNINDLSRSDLLTTKRIRVRNVEIGGTLQVGIGNASRDTIDDENRFLRQQLNDLQAAQQQTQNTVGTLQTSLTGTTSMLQGSIGQVQATVGSLTSDVGTLKSQATNIHVYSCTEHTSTVVVDGPRGWWTMWQSPVVCPAGKYLTHWQLMDVSDNDFHYAFTCC
jgi:hypothetical protein